MALMVPSAKVTLPVGVVVLPLLTIAVIVTDCPYCDGLRFEVSVVVVLAVKSTARTGCNSIPFGATPVWPCRKSKNPTPVICTGTLTCWNVFVAVNMLSNFARAVVMPSENGLLISWRGEVGDRMQAGDGISVTMVRP